MNTSFLIVCETQINTQILERAIAAVFSENSIMSSENISNKVKHNTQSNSESLTEFNPHIQSISFEDKDDYRAKESGIYQIYESNQLLFLGNVTDYSIPLQEGMLRLIEEPPNNLSLVLFCHDIVDVLPTIISRCRVIYLPRSIIMNLLQKSEMEFIKKNFPLVKDFIQDWLVNSITEVKLSPKSTRDHIDAWLWQIGCYLDALYSKSPSISLAKAIEHIGYARRLNRDNVQKKFVIESLFV